MQAEKSANHLGVFGGSLRLCANHSVEKGDLHADHGYPGEAIVTNSLEEQGGKTILTLNIQYDSNEAREIALKTDMEKGVGASYDRLEVMLASQQTS